MIVATLSTGVIDSLKSAFYMFYDTFWALVLGFGLSGAVQAFVSKESMKRQLPNHGPMSLLKASLYGIASSSCSYAASAMSKSLFKKGADFISSIAFMVASTNLVIELGLVIVVLIGWQFVIGEFLGGILMIVLLGVLGGYVLNKKVSKDALTHLESLDISTFENDDPACLVEVDETSNIRKLSGWSDASTFAVSDAKMLRKELFIGFLVAGILSATVPTHVWHLLFISNHGQLTSIENALVGPLVAVLSWVCSVGNIPLAASLWGGGISYGGVISFIFADLISMPLLLIYRKFYGTKIALKIFVILFFVMAISGYVIGELMSVVHLVPNHASTKFYSESIKFNYSLVLNLISLVIVGAIYFLYRNQSRYGGGKSLAIDPICKMQVRKSSAPAIYKSGSETVWFCSDRCKETYIERTKRTNLGVEIKSIPTNKEGEKNMGEEEKEYIDPVCNMVVEPESAAGSVEYEGETIYFCNLGCKDRFLKEPEKYIAKN